MTNNEPVSVLFARSDSIYKALGVDVWDAQRNALLWPGGNSIVAHPPCRLWGRLRQFSKADPEEKELARFAVRQVRYWGGVLEHPYKSTLWEEEKLPSPGDRDLWGGWTLPIYQHTFGHRAEKKTWLYIVGCDPKDLPDIPLVLDKASHCIRPSKVNKLPIVTKAEREHTPVLLAQWLISVAQICNAHLKGREVSQCR